MIWNFVLALFLGMAITLVAVVRLAAGTLKVYIPNDEEESPYLCVELDKPIASICKKKIVLFEVDVRNLDSQN